MAGQQSYSMPLPGYYRSLSRSPRIRRRNSTTPSDHNNWENYDAHTSCRSAGIIPYTFINGSLFFLLQHLDNPFKENDKGWNDFGGKRNYVGETPPEIASREFNEETSCLFYLDIHNQELFNKMLNNPHLEYDDDTMAQLQETIPVASKYFYDKITSVPTPLYVSAKDVYISYFVKMNHIPERIIPAAEDIHIDYEDRYRRTCKWFSYDEIINNNSSIFHKRLQITNLQYRIKYFYSKKLFN
jgi:hypothetical protein